MGVVYSNLRSLEHGRYVKVSSPLFTAYDIYEAPEWPAYNAACERASEEFRRTGNYDQFAATTKPLSDARITAIWMKCKEREKKASLLLRYFQAERNLKTSRTFWETRAEAERSPEQIATDEFLGRLPGDTERLAWIGEACRNARINQQDFKRMQFLTDTEYEEL